jgi:hypothetical protein
MQHGHQQHAQLVAPCKPCRYAVVVICMMWSRAGHDVVRHRVVHSARADRGPRVRAAHVLRGACAPRGRERLERFHHLRARVRRRERLRHKGAVPNTLRGQLGADAKCRRPRSAVRRAPGGAFAASAAFTCSRQAMQLSSSLLAAARAVMWRSWNNTRSRDHVYEECSVIP